MRVTSARRRSLRRPGAGALAARAFDPQELTLPVPSTFLLWGRVSATLAAPTPLWVVSDHPGVPPVARAPGRHPPEGRRGRCR